MQAVVETGDEPIASNRREADQDISLTQSNRTFFLKLGYSWVL